jgi:membrane associated rhomboid family serine protease
MRYSGYQRVGFGGFHLTPWVKRLMLVNGAVFLLTMLVGRPLMFDLFAFQPSRVLTRPWGVGTYMFLHYDFWHLFLNMLVLFFFGPPLEDRWGSREFLKFYAICGLGGAALSFLFAGYSIVGASAAVYGIMLAFAMNWPDSPIYIWGIFPVKAKWLVAFLFLASVFSAFGSTGGGVAHFAHLGGLAAGFLYLKADWRLPGERGGKGSSRSRTRVAIVPREGETRRKAAAGQARRRGGEAGWSRADDDALLDEVDRVLDKISAEGMAALTPSERALLDEVSKRHRTN